MSEPVLKLLHVAPWARTIGGIEAVLARHAEVDAILGFDSHQVSLFDKAPSLPEEPYSPQAFSWRTTPRQMRMAMARTCANHAGSVVVWQGAWGLPWFADNDGSRRRIIYLHDNFARYAPLLPHLTGLVDGVFCCSKATAQQVLLQMPGMTSDRVAVPPLPIFPPAELDFRRPEKREWIVGYVGRVERTHKRLDRLIPFMSEINRLGINCRVEVMGGGSLLPWLMRRLGANPSVRFLGVQKGANYWRVLQSWDAVVSFSDHEGGPIALLEAMSAGAIPIYPTMMGSLGDDYTPQVDPRGYYAAGDPRAAARALQSLSSSPPQEVAEMHQRAHTLAWRHAVGDYERVFSDFVHRVAKLPRISRAPRGARQARLTDWLPLGLITRLLPGALLR